MAVAPFALAHHLLHAHQFPPHLASKVQLLALMNARKTHSSPSAAQASAQIVLHLIGT